MNPGILVCAVLLFFPSTAANASETNSSTLFHASFDSFDFLVDDIIERSGHLTADDRGLTLETGRFGNGVKLNIMPVGVTPASDSMHVILLDTVTRLIYHVERAHDDYHMFTGPIYWGTGRLNPLGGAVAFWAKGELTEGDLFNQTAMSWGRKEENLLAITADNNGRIGAYIDDARYNRHTIVSDHEWDDSRWNHVLLNFDRANGLELYVNGEPVASSWGSYSWWETQPPGLFHCNMSHVSYDELFIFSHPLSQSEIVNLMHDNSPPSSGALSKRLTGERDRLARSFGIAGEIALPTIKPSTDSHALSWREITPDCFGDGNIPARFCHDGGYDLAWPHNIGAFTWVPGDADFQAEKLDIEAPENVPWNYISIEGNLNGLDSILTDAVKTDDRFSGSALCNIPDDGQFFYGKLLERQVHPRITLPFLKGYGAPEEYTGDVRLPITGKTRIHEVGIFDITGTTIDSVPGEIEFHLTSGGALDSRTEFALKAVHSLVDRQVLTGNQTDSGGEQEWIDTGSLRRLNLITAPMTGKRCIGGILLDLNVKTEKPEDVLLVRLHDPCLPHRIWTHAEVKLVGFDGDGGRLRLLLEPAPLILEQGDVVWLDIAMLNDAVVKCGGADGSRIILRPAPLHESEKAYETKALMPAMAEYSRGYEYSPWLFEGTWPNIESPEVFGGRYDILNSALAVKRALPWSRLADYYIEWSKPKYKWGYFWNLNQHQYFRHSDNLPEDFFPVKDIPIPDSVPRWAYLQHRIQNLRYRFIEWLENNQNPDGQFGGGWNDDVLIMRARHDIPLDGHEGARDVFLRVNEGLDRTLQFAGGYCRILPIDTGHVHDFIRYRHLALLFKPGDPFVWRRAMETAWHWDKPDKTPLNYRDGSAFLDEKNMLEWLWGLRTQDAPYVSAPADSIEHEFARLVSYMNDNLFHRITEARVHTDHRWFEQDTLIMNMILGGEPERSLAIAVSWPEGGGEDVARWVTYADNESLICRMYSFDRVTRNLTGRLYRIAGGDVEITLSEDRDGTPGKILFTDTIRMKRFDEFTVPVPPDKPVILTIRRTDKGTALSQLPDLATTDYECERSGGSLRVRVSNLGGAGSEKTTVRLSDADGKVLETADVPALDAPGDFVEKSVWISFDNVPADGTFIIEIDPENTQMEMFERNNKAVIGE